MSTIKNQATPRQRLKITKRLVDALEPADRLLEVRDAEVIGFSIRITPAGVKSYAYQWRDRAGTYRRETIGRHGTITADHARTIAQQWAGIVASGGDPCPKDTASSQTTTMAELHVLYMKKHACFKKPRSRLNDDGYWRNHILPAMGTLQVAKVTQVDVAALHLAMRATPTNANRVLEVVRKAMNLAEVWRLRTGNNPCSGVKPYRLKKRKRYLSPAEAKRLGAHLAELDRWGGIDARFAALVRLELYTGARTGEWLGARWADLDLDRGVLALGDTKSNEAQELIITPAAEMVLAGIKRVLGNPYIIAGKRKGKPLVGYRRMWLRLCEACGFNDLRMHDLRHSFASYTLTATGNLAMVGGLLRHADPQTTARYGHLLDDPLKAAAHSGSGSIAALVDGIPAGSNVIALKQ